MHASYCHLADYVIFMQDNDMNIRIYSEEQDDVQNETWQIIVRFHIR